MRNATYFILIVLILFISHSCGEDERARTCDDLINDICDGMTPGGYCSLGIKWGDESTFPPGGVDVPGPGISGGCISVSIMTEATYVENSVFGSSTASSPLDKATCFEEELNKAMAAWNRVADIKLILTGRDIQEADVNVYAADIGGLNLGYGNIDITNFVCGRYTGSLIVNDRPTESCFNLFITLLHELGHVLGLGHVEGDVIMQAGVGKFELSGLQKGDMDGVISIYGEAL